MQKNRKELKRSSIFQQTELCIEKSRCFETEVDARNAFFQFEKIKIIKMLPQQS